MTITFTVPDMACSACAETITRAIQAVDNSAAVTADSTTKQVCVTATVTESDLRHAIELAGYHPT
jgi:copper chaperone